MVSKAISNKIKELKKIDKSIKSFSKTSQIQDYKFQLNIRFKKLKNQIPTMIISVQKFIKSDKFIWTNNIRISLIGDAIMDITLFEMHLEIGIIKDLYKKELLKEQEMREIIQLIKERSNTKNAECRSVLQSVNRP